MDSPDGHAPHAAPPPGAAPSPPRSGEEGAGGTRLTAHDIHENVSAAAQEELEKPAAALLWSGLAAGLTISFSFVVGAWLSELGHSDTTKKALTALGYPIGFVFVVLARQQLFTEKTLEPVLPLLEDFSGRRLRRLLRLWGLVLLANLAGAAVIGLLLARTEMVESSLRVALEATAEHAVRGGFAVVFYKAIFAGWLVALMTWLVAATRQTAAQILLVALTTIPISALGFRHSIAGSVEAIFLAARGGHGWGAMFGDFIVPAILGNVVGGVVFVALLQHGQVAAAREG